jgi:hypothetical protein
VPKTAAGIDRGGAVGVSGHGVPSRRR